MQIQQININNIIFSKTNRQIAEDDKLKSLARSIGKHGVRQPVLVRPKGKKFELVAGERRVRASRRAGLLMVPAIVKEMPDAEALEVQIIENVQRVDLSPMEEALAYKRMVDELGYTIREICERVDKSDAHVYQTLSLATLPPAAVAALNDGRLSKSVAVMIAQLEDRQMQISATNQLLPPEWSDEPTTAKAAKSLILKLKSAANQKPKGRTAGKGRAPEASKSGKEDFVKDWRFYLVRFESADFMKFRAICNGRHDQETMAEAVFVVMMDKRAEVRRASV